MSKWTQNEKNLLMSYVWVDDSETFHEQIEHAHYMLYKDGQHPEFKEKTISACKNMFYKICKKNKFLKEGKQDKKV